MVYLYGSEREIGKVQEQTYQKVGIFFIPLKI